MSYAIRNDGLGWRAVASAADCTDDETFSVNQPPIVELQPPVAEVTTVTMRQARLALLRAGLLDNVQAAINALPEPMRREAQIQWEFAADVIKTDPLIVALAPQLGLDADDLTDLFEIAATL